MQAREPLDIPAPSAFTHGHAATFLHTRKEVNNLERLCYSLFFQMSDPDLCS